MTPEGGIGAAQEALSHHDPAYASELYEVAARKMVEADQERAAHLYRLASMYASENYSRQDQLAAEAQRLLELFDDQSSQIADVLLGRAKSAEQAGQIGRAFLHYVQCLRAIAKILHDAAESYLSGEDVPLRLGEETQLLSEKLLYCARRIREIEGTDA